MLRRRGAEADLTLRYSNEETAKVVADAVNPDNFQAPEGMEVSVMVKEARIEVHIFCPKGIGSLISTLDDLMSCLATAERTINGLR